MTARKRLLNHGGHELVTFERGTLAPSSVCPRRSLWQDERVNNRCELDPCHRAHSAHDSANRDLYLKRNGRMPAKGSRLGTTSADAYARGHSAGDVGLDAQVKGKATRALPIMKANRDG